MTRLKGIIAVCLLMLCHSGANAGLIITGIVDGSLSGGLPKAVEFFATSDIANLGIYGFGSANNGASPVTQEYTFTGSASAGEFLYISNEIPGFTSFFGFAPTVGNVAAASINGNDAIGLFMNGSVIDVFGVIGVDGSGQPWEYTDGWAYRKDGTGPDGTTFVLSNWTFSGINALDGVTTNASANSPFPIGTYTAGANVPSPATLALFGLGLAGLGWSRRKKA